MFLLVIIITCYHKSCLVGLELGSSDAILTLIQWLMSVERAQDDFMVSCNIMDNYIKPTAGVSRELVHLYKG